MSIRKKIADSEWAKSAVARLFAGYVRLVHATSAWDRIGYAPLDDLVAAGEPVIVVVWHQRLVMGSYMFPLDLAPLCGITSAARAGSMFGRIQTRFGMQHIAMASRQRHVALSREVILKVREGVSVALAADGPRGPERICSQVPLQWARATGKRVFVVACATRHAMEAATWDRMLFPRPMTRGVMLCREWDKHVPRKASEAEIEDLRLDLQAHLNAVTAEADEYIGREVYVPSTS